MARFTRAAHAFEDFTGRKPRKVRRTKLDSQDVVGWEMGPAVGVAYEAVRDGEKAQYFHEFAKQARPALVARDDGKQLYLVDGKYTVTERGIEDMPELFVVNPSARRGAASKRKAMATPKRNRSGRFVKGSAKRRAAPARRRRASRQVAIFSANPTARPKRRRAAKRTTTKRRTYRRNPSGRKMFGGIGQLIIPAAGVGGGAVLAELFMGYLPIPANFKSGVMRQVTKGAVGLAAGWVISNVLKQKKLGFYVMAGAVVIAVHDGIKEFLVSRAPDFSGKGAFGQYVAPLRRQFGGGMGYINPAQTQRLGQYVKPLRSQFAGDAVVYAHPGGETGFQA